MLPRRSAISTARHVDPYVRYSATLTTASTLVTNPPDSRLMVIANTPTARIVYTGVAVLSLTWLHTLENGSIRSLARENPVLVATAMFASRQESIATKA